jgi:hypothetical protein
VPLRSAPLLAGEPARFARAYAAGRMDWEDFDPSVREEVENRVCYV